MQDQQLHVCVSVPPTWRNIFPGFCCRCSAARETATIERVLQQQNLVRELINSLFYLVSGLWFAIREMSRDEREGPLAQLGANTW